MHYYVKNILFLADFSFSLDHLLRSLPIFYAFFYRSGFRVTGTTNAPLFFFFNASQDLRTLTLFFFGSLS